MPFDAARFALLAEPLQVRVTREIPDGKGGVAVEPLGLANDGVGFTRAQVEISSMERVARENWGGGGNYKVSATDAHAQIFEYEMYLPGTLRADPAKAAPVGQPAYAQQGSAFGAAQAPFQPPYGAMPPAAPQGWQPAPQTAAAPYGQAFAPQTYAPQQPQGAPQWWQPQLDAAPPGVHPQWWAAQQPWQRQQYLQATGGYGVSSVPSMWPATTMPPPVAPGGAGDLAMVARLDALQLQNQQLREQQLLRTSSEAAERQATQLQAMMTQQAAAQAESNRRMEMLVEKLMTGGGNRREEDRIIEMERRLAEQARESAAAILRAEMQGVRDAQQRDRDALQAQMAVAKEAGSNSMLTQLMQQGQQQQTAHLNTLVQVMKEAQQKQTSLPEMMAMFKSLATSEKDPVVAAMLELAMDRLRGGGESAGPSTAQVIADSVARLGEVGQKIATAAIAGKTDEGIAKTRVEAEARQRLAAQQAALNARAAQAQNPQQRPPQMNGAAAAAAPAQQPAPEQPPEAPPESDPRLSAAQNEQLAEARFFGPLAQYLPRIRAAAANSVDPALVARSVAASLVHNALDWEIEPGKVPAFRALIPGPDRNVLGVVSRALPDAPAVYRNQLAEELEKAVDEELRQAQEAQAEEEAEDAAAEKGNGVATG